MLNWDTLCELHDGKLEELVAAVAHSYFDCETRWVGRSHDGGIDVIAVLSDAPMAIQVKRRARTDSVEGVQLVREFCGAMIAEGFRKGMIVSSADHYSKPAQKTVDKIVSNSQICELHLVDSKSFCEMFDLVIGTK